MTWNMVESTLCRNKHVNIECTYIRVSEPEFTSNPGLATYLLYTYSTHVADLHEMNIPVVVDNVSLVIFSYR